MKRRTLLSKTLQAGCMLSIGSSRILGANDAIRVGVIGMGSFVKIGGRGRRDAREFQAIDGVRVDAICDCDGDHLDYDIDKFKSQNIPVKAYKDFRDVLDDSDIDAVSITTPNHWHSLMTILACQAGKDVYVQKPSSHNIYEGRKMVEAMNKYGRIVQATHGPRNSGETAEAYEYVWEGNLGAIQYVHGLNYRPRMSIGKVKEPQTIPELCDYDLWCGPAPKNPLTREFLHYDWHWDWDTGNGDLGNMGIHAMDGCRWALNKNHLPKRVMSIGGRRGYDDDGETPNTLITLFDYEPAPIIFEVRGLPKDASYLDQTWTKNSGQTMDHYRGMRIGTIVVCENGYIQDNAAYDNNGKKIKAFTRQRVSTKQNFIDAMRSGKKDHLFTDALQGHLSCGLVHLANISYRVGKQTPSGEIRDAVQGKTKFADAFERLMRHMAANKIDLKAEPLVMGPMLSFDPVSERFTGAFSEKANPHLSREYREPFVLPSLV